MKHSLKDQVRAERDILTAVVYYQLHSTTQRRYVITALRMERIDTIFYRFQC